MRVTNGRMIDFEVRLRGIGEAAVVEFYRFGSRAPLKVQRAQDFLRAYADFRHGTAHLGVGPMLHVEYLEPAGVGEVIDWLRAHLDGGEPLAAEDLAPERVGLELARLHWCEGTPEPYLGGCVGARLHLGIVREGGEDFTIYFVNAGVEFDAVAADRYRVPFARLRGVANYERGKVELRGQARAGLLVEVVETPSAFTDPWREDPSWQPYTVYLLPPAGTAVASSGRSEGAGERRAEGGLEVQSEIQGEGREENGRTEVAHE